MGYYIQTPENLNKVEQLIKLHDATWALLYDRYEDIPKDKALIAVVQNGAFDAALFIPDKQEFDYIKRAMPTDPRPCSYVLMDRKLAEELSGWKPERPDY